MFVSDNGKTFKAAVKTINAMLQHKEVQGYLSGVGIQWLFNLEEHLGGEVYLSGW